MVHTGHEEASLVDRTASLSVPWHISANFASNEQTIACIVTYFSDLYLLPAAGGPIRSLSGDCIPGIPTMRLQLLSISSNYWQERIF